GVETDGARGELVAVVERDRERRGPVDDVRIGERVAVAVDDEARADDRLEAPLRTLLVDLHGLDRDHGRRDALEEHGEGLGALRGGGGGRDQHEGGERSPEQHGGEYTIEV